MQLGYLLSFGLVTSLAQVTPFWPVLFLNSSFYFRAMERSKNIPSAVFHLTHWHTHEGPLSYPFLAKETVLSALCQWGLPVSLIQYLILLMIQEKRLWYTLESMRRCRELAAASSSPMSAPSVASKEPWKRRGWGSWGSWELDPEFIPGSGQPS